MPDISNHTHKNQRDNEASNFALFLLIPDELLVEAFEIHGHHHDSMKRVSKALDVSINMLTARLLLTARKIPEKRLKIKIAL